MDEDANQSTSPGNDSVTFWVQGSAPEPYRVVFRKKAQNLTGHCTCPAGEVGQYCKHRFKILEGDTEGVVSKNERMVEVVKNWLPGTDVETALREVKQAELEYDREVKKLKKILTGYKKKLARSLMD